MVVLTRSVIEAPAALRIAATFWRAWSVWASIPIGMEPVSGSIPAVPEQKTKPPATMAWLYGPRAAGAWSVETACRFMSYPCPFPVMRFSRDDTQPTCLRSPHSCSERRDRTTAVLSAGRGRPAWTSFGFLVRALPVVVPASRCGGRCLSLVAPCICWRVGGTRDMPVEVLFPERRERFEVGSSGWSRVLGIDAVGGAPHCDFTKEGGARVTFRCSPDWLVVALAGVVLDLAGEVGDELGSFCQVEPPDGMVMERWWNAREPGQRTWIDRRQPWEAPIEDGGHVAGSTEVASGGGCQHVAKWVLSSFGREGEQVCPQGWPSGFNGESGDVPVGLVELCDGLEVRRAVRLRRGGRRCSAAPPGKAGPLGC